MFSTESEKGEAKCSAQCQNKGVSGVYSVASLGVSGVLQCWSMGMSGIKHSQSRRGGGGGGGQIFITVLEQEGISVA